MAQIPGSSRNSSVEERMAHRGGRRRLSDARTTIRSRKERAMTRHFKHQGWPMPSVRSRRCAAAALLPFAAVASIGNGLQHHRSSAREECA
jgi:hypothetical protein